MSDQTDPTIVALCAVQSELSATGIAKDGRNAAQNFSFRGIDQVMNALAPLMAKHRLIFLPAYDVLSSESRATTKGGSLFVVTVRLVGRWMAPGGSEIQCSSIGEGADSGDKATNKAMSAALKYLVLQTFMIPVEGMEDSDRDSPPESYRNPPPRPAADTAVGAAFLTKEQFRKRWGSNNDSDLTNDDIAACYVGWGLGSRPKTKPMGGVIEAVLQAAGVEVPPPQPKDGGGPGIGAMLRILGFQKDEALALFESNTGRKFLNVRDAAARMTADERVKVSAALQAEIALRGSSGASEGAGA